MFSPSRKQHNNKQRLTTDLFERLNFEQSFSKPFFKELLTSWVNPEQESRPCRVCPRAVGMISLQNNQNTQWLCVDVAGYKIVNVYKPPRLRLTPTTIPTFPHPSLYVGDFNCQRVNWGYNTTSLDGESLYSWATSNNLGLLYNPKETASFFSHRWNVGTNPDLAFASLGQDS